MSKSEEEKQEEKAGHTRKEEDSAKGHGFSPGEGHDHSHDLKDVSSKRLWWALLFNLVFLIIEVIGGIMANSLALLADAGHMLTDVAALGLALFMAYLARKPSTPERTFGLLRAEVLGAFINGATLVLIVGLVFREAWARIGDPQEVEGPFMLAIAVAGLFANVISAFILRGGSKENINVRGAFLHMVADALGSVGAIIAGAVIWTTGWYLIDPIASAVIGILILISGAGLLRETMNILLEATPRHIDYQEVKDALENIENIEAVHDLHIWTITSGKPVLSAHISLSRACCEQNRWQECLQKAQELLEEKFHIHHSTLQVEPPEMSEDGECTLIE